MITVHTPQKTYSLTAPDEGSALDLMRSAGIEVYVPCNGRGICGRCAVRDKSGETRLACRTPARDGLEVWYSPADGAARIVTDGGGALGAELDPAVKKIAFTMPDNDDDLPDLLDGADLPPGLLCMAAPGDSLTAVIQEGDVTGLEPGDTRGALLGAAVDIGTTTLAGYLLDLTSGELLASAGALNPQRAHGADVCSRMDFAAAGDGAVLLRDEIIKAIGSLIGDLCQKAGRGANEIYRMALAGNTVMLHFLMGFETKTLAVAPFVPVSVSPRRFPARIICPDAGTGAVAELLPCVAAYVGADTVAAALAANMDGGGGTSLLIDLGTNGEIVLRHEGRLYACSAAAGPAFEGGGISCGMPGIDGAVDSFSLDGGALTIGSKPPAGLCGTGLVDVAAELLRAGIIDETGRLSDGQDFEIAPGVTLTQADIRALQCAKAAVAAGIRVLLQEAGASPDEVETLYLAGGFGTFMNAQNAAAIGLIPSAAANVSCIGNAAGMGAVADVLSQKVSARAAAMEMNYVELSSNAAFNEFYTDCMMFESW